MRTSYMPKKQYEAVAWSGNFAAMLANQPETYGLTTNQATAFAAVNTTLQAAYLAATTPETKNIVTVANKDAALAAMKVVARNLVSIIQGTPSVTDGQKLALGLTVRAAPTTIPAPTVSPLIKIRSVDARNVTVELLQSASKRGKPAGVAAAMIFTHCGTSEPTTLADWQYALTATRTVVDLPFGPSETGDTAYVTAFWCNAKGQAGPAARPASVNLAAGNALPREASEKPKLKIAA